ncbi:MAG: hypothetical protein WA815_04420 [Terracidiphilus sp.]
MGRLIGMADYGGIGSSAEFYYSGGTLYELGFEEQKPLRIDDTLGHERALCACGLI